MRQQILGFVALLAFIACANAQTPGSLFPAPQSPAGAGQAVGDAASAPPARGYIGVGVNDLSPAGVQTLGTQGAIVMQVAPDAPAARAGVLVGDVITAINGAPVTQAAGVVASLSQLSPGSIVRLQILRGRQSGTVNVLVAPGPNPLTQSGGLAAGAPVSGGAAGLSAQPSPQAPLSAGLDAWKPDSQVGDLQFTVPSGWTKSQVREGIVLTPNRLPPNSVAMIGVLTPETTNNPRAWFDAAWADWKTRMKMNLTFPGEPEVKHNANGFDVLRKYSGAFGPTIGSNGMFILGAVIAGNRVSPYFFLCNTNCQGAIDTYEFVFEDFERGLSLASLGQSIPVVHGGGTAGGLHGLYTSFRLSEGDAALGTFKISGGIVYLAFFPDGNVVRYLPKEGLENFDFRSAVRTARQSCGRYQLDGDQINITWGDGSTYTGARDGTKLRISDHVSSGFNGNYDSLGYEPAANSDGLNLSAGYHPEGADPRARIVFAPDGRFAENGALSAVSIPASPGTGSYHIKDNTLTLSYSDGRVIKVSFFVSASEERSQQPSLIHLNGYALPKATN